MVINWYRCNGSRRSTSGPPLLSTGAGWALTLGEVVNASRINPIHDESDESGDRPPSASGGRPSTTVFPNRSPG